MKWTFVLLAMLVLVPSVHAAATIAEIYSAASEAERYAGPTNSTCQNGETIYLCNDSQFPTIADVYTVLGDGSTSAASGSSFQDKGNTQTSFFKLVYDLDGLLEGEYYLRFAVSADTLFTYQICPYMSDSNVNASLCQNYTHEGGEGIWVEAEIGDMVRASSATFDYRVILRVIATGGYSVTTTETYLKRPFKPADFTIIPGGVQEAEVDTRLRNTWAIVSIAEIPDITNASCTVWKLPKINASVSEVNLSLLNPSYEICEDNKCFAISWDANSSVQNFEEGYNYEIVCVGYLGDIYMDGFSQFVYINREKSLWENIAQFIQYFLQLIGITQDTQQLVSGQAEMVDARAGYGETAYATTFLTYADGTVDVNASCYLDVWYPNSTQWIDEQGMTAMGTDGRYTYEMTAPQVDGSYQMRSFCNGTALMNRTRYAYANFEVFDNVVMKMIT